MARARFVGPSKTELEAMVARSKSLLSNANKRARDTKEALVAVVEGEPMVEMGWAALGSGATVAGAVAGACVQGLTDFYVDDKYDLWISGGIVAVSVVTGVVSLGAGLMGWQRTGAVGLSASTGFGMAGVIDGTRMLTGRATEMLNQQVAA